MTLISEPPATLVILCKRPLPGQGKQRLAASIGVDSAYKIAEALLSCALEDAVQWQGLVVLSPAHSEDQVWARQRLDQAGLPRAKVLPQATGNLGQRLTGLDQQLREQGVEKTLYIGTDAPMLTAEHYQQTLAALNQYDAVFSNAEDGGVVLMANRLPWPQLQELPWSTDSLGEALQHCCTRQGMTIGLISPGYDIDQAQDLIRSRQDLQAEQRPARQQLGKIIEDICGRND